MAIRKPDGSVYKVLGTQQQFDPDNAAHDLFNRWDEEIIKSFGSPIYYYSVFIQTATLDRVYMEDRTKLFSPVPLELFCLYEPVQSMNDMGVMGMDPGFDQVIFEFNYKAVLRDLGHVPKLGSRFYTPHLGENWVIVKRGLAEFQMWGALRLEITCLRFQESLTTGEGNVTQKRPDYKFNDIR